LNNLILYITKSESKLLNTIKLNQTDQIIEMKDDSISTQHCALFYDQMSKSLKAVDLGSINGSYKLVKMNEYFNLFQGTEILFNNVILKVGQVGDFIEFEFEGETGIITFNNMIQIKNKNNQGHYNFFSSFKNLVCFDDNAGWLLKGDQYNEVYVRIYPNSQAILSNFDVVNIANKMKLQIFFCSCNVSKSNLRCNNNHNLCEICYSSLQNCLFCEELMNKNYSNHNNMNNNMNYNNNNNINNNINNNFQYQQNTNNSNLNNFNPTRINLKIQNNSNNFKKI